MSNKVKLAKQKGIGKIASHSKGGFRSHAVIIIE